MLRCTAHATCESAGGSALAGSGFLEPGGEIRSSLEENLGRFATNSVSGLTGGKNVLPRSAHELSGTQTASQDARAAKPLQCFLSPSLS